MSTVSDQAAEIKNLRWCVGKLVYIRGSDKPMHFMELKSFIIEDAVDYSHLFYLRGLRYKSNNTNAADDELTRWMGATAVKPMAEVVAHLANHCRDRDVRLVEWFPGVGLTGEYARFLLQPRDGGRAAKSIVSYTGRGPAVLKNQFMVLQTDKEIEVDYSDNLGVSPADEGSIAVVNLNHALKYESDPDFDLSAFIATCTAPVIVAMRLDLGSEAAWHTTVKGRRVKLATLSEAKSLLKASGRSFSYRVIEKFDAGFFLPIKGRQTGLVLAYAGGPTQQLEAFEAV